MNRAEGHYWVSWRSSGKWDVYYWRDGCFWDHGDCGYYEEDLTVGPRVFPPGTLLPVTQLPPRGLRLPAQRGYCDQCQLERVAWGRE